MNEDEIKDETTLAALAEKPHAFDHALLFAVIIEISEPRKVDDASNYLTRVKVIDPSFNYKSRVNSPHLKFHKFVHISVFSETPEHAPRIKYVGDIIRLRRFRFKFSDRNEFKAYERNYSNWLIYSGRKGDTLAAQCHKQFEKNLGRALNKYEEGRVTDLRFWADHFFFTQSMRYITWWVDLPKPSEKDDPALPRAYPNVDLLLRLQRVGPSKTRLHFADNLDRAFELELPSVSLAVGDVIQLKCVTVSVEPRAEGPRRTITLTANSNCQHIPKFFLDHRVFDRGQAAERSAAASVGKGAAPPKFLAEFTSEPDCRAGRSARKGAQPRLVSAVRTSAKGMELTPIADALQVLREDPQSYLNKKFLVEGAITGFLSLEPAEIVKRFYPQSKQVERLDQPAGDRRHRALYHLTPLLKDESVTADQHLQAHILTNEHEFYMFDSWDILPAYDDAEGWASVKENRLQEFVKKLNALKKPEYKVLLVVQLMMTPNSKYFFKVVDSIFVSF